MKIGAQLFTAREHTTNLNDFSETLKKIADMGYNYVQVSGTCAYEAEWLKEQLAVSGLECPVTHTPPDRIADDTENVARDHNVFGCSITGIGMAPGGFANGLADYAAFKERFMPAAEKLKTFGVKLGYHNHHVEFQRFGDKTILDMMVEDFSKEQLAIILDTYWVQYSGGNPTEWIRKLKGYLSCIHFKDMTIIIDKQKIAAVGEGNLNWNDIIAACNESEVDFAFVEQDDCNGEDSLECLRRSYNYLHSLGLD